jgi:crotonobetainyl-CoA:carnitine CoA-transferase CaiB-like acyl-CoA transferase
MEALQKAGVAAGAVLTNQEMVENHVLAPDFFVPIEENWGETVPYPRFPAPIEGMERHSWHRAPRLGEHNRLVLMKLLGKTDKEINELEQAGTIAHRPGF